MTISQGKVVREIQPNEKRCEWIRIYNFEGELFFGSAPEFERLLESIEEGASSPLRVVILRLKRARNPDSVCMMILDTFAQNMIDKGITVILSGVDAEMLAVLTNVGMVRRIGRENVFLEQSEIWGSTSQALNRAYLIFGSERCPQCTKCST